MYIILFCELSGGEQHNREGDEACSVRTRRSAQHYAQAASQPVLRYRLSQQDDQVRNTPQTRRIAQ